MLGEATLVDWCTRHEVSVEFRNGSQTFSNYDHQRRIIIASARTERARLFMLVHEIGHCIIRNRTSSYLPSSPYVARERTVAARLAVVQEEFNAWTEGRWLAERLGLVLDERAFDRCRAQCLRSYMEQYLYPHRYE